MNWPWWRRASPRQYRRWGSPGGPEGGDREGGLPHRLLLPARRQAAGVRQRWQRRRRPALRRRIRGTVQGRGPSRSPRHRPQGRQRRPHCLVQRRRLRLRFRPGMWRRWGGAGTSWWGSAPAAAPPSPRGGARGRPAAPRPSPIKPTPGGPRDSRRTGRRGVMRTMSNMRELYALTNPQHVLHRRRPLEAVTSVLPASPPGSRFPKHGRARRKGGRPGAPFYDSASPCGQAYARHRNDGGLSWGSYRGRR